MRIQSSVRNINVKVFNLTSRSNQTRHTEWHESCKCKCRLDASVCNNKQRWIEDKYKCECKELIDIGRCDEGFIWNPSNCECDYDISCYVGEDLGYKNCNCRNKIVGELVEQCINGNEMIYNGTVNDYGNACNSCTKWKVLSVIFSVISISISSAFIYFHWYLKRNNTHAKQHFIKHINDNFQKINLNHLYYLLSNMTNMKSCNPNLVSINKISYKNTDVVVCNIKYIMMESINNQNIHSKNPLCLIFSDVDY